VEPERARGAVRVSFGAANSVEQVEQFVSALSAVVARLRQLAAVVV
jgi:cysteine sulfinate desulfinase/cysteine desulfurase-like protein